MLGGPEPHTSRHNEKCGITNVIEKTNMVKLKGFKR